MSPAEIAKRQEALAEKIADKARAALRPLEREMQAMKWPADFKVIMWEVVSHTAQGYAELEKERHHGEG